MPNHNLNAIIFMAAMTLPIAASANDAPADTTSKTAKVAYQATTTAPTDAVETDALILAKATTLDADQDWLRITYRAQDQAIVKRNINSSAESRYIDMGEKGMRPAKIETAEQVDNSVTLEFEMGSGEAPEGEYVHYVDRPQG